MGREVAIATSNFAIQEVHTFDEFAGHSAAVLDGAKGADIVLLPELFTLELFTCLPGWGERELTDIGEIAQYTEDYRRFFGDEAKVRGQWLLAGSHLVREGGRLLNMAHLFGPQGQLFTHAKTHLFPVEHTLGIDEGDEMVAIDLPFARVAINICYEAEIPECSTVVAQRGVEVMLCPSYTFTEHGFWRVRYCAQARAIENQIYVVHSCTGGEKLGPLPGGWARGSILSPCDLPWNATGIVAECDPNVEGTVVGTVDLDALYANREHGAATTYNDRIRRADVYRRWAS
jgi:predicted amidohydrolase